MKKYVLLFTVFTCLLSSCNIDDNSSFNYYLEVLPIESVDIPEQFTFGETYEISMTYFKHSTCYQFNDFIYEINGNERTVAIVNTVYYGGDTNCVEELEEVTVSFDFIATGTETYLFKFYQGVDDEGSDQYYLVEVPVVIE
jgi:hypothetical protein